MCPPYASGPETNKRQPILLALISGLKGAKGGLKGVAYAGQLLRDFPQPGRGLLVAGAWVAPVFGRMTASCPKQYRRYVFAAAQARRRRGVQCWQGALRGAYGEKPVGQTPERLE